MIRNSLGLLALCYGIGLTSHATAARIVQTQGFVGVPSVAKTVEFDRFKPSYGQLISAEWQLLLEIDGGAQVLDNDTTSPRSVDVSLGARGTLSSLDVDLLDAQMAPIGQGHTAALAITNSRLELGSDDGDGAAFDSTGPDAGILEGGLVSAMTSGLVNPSLLDAYIGTEMFEVRINIEQTADAGGTDGISRQLMPVTASPHVVLIYEFNPVPEPNGLWMAAAGILLAFIRFHSDRRRFD